MGFIVRILLGCTMPLPLLCGFIAFGTLALLCGALLCGITTYSAKGVFFIYGMPMLFGELLKHVLGNNLAQNLLEITFLLGNNAFFYAPKSFLQSFIFEDATKFDSLSDMNELTLIKEQDKVKCMNEVATDLSAVLVQPTISEQEGLVFN